MAMFSSLFYEGALSEGLSQSAAQSIYPCNVNISDGIIAIDYYPSYKKDNKLGSFTMNLSDAIVGGKRNFSIAMIPIESVVIEDGSKAFSLANIGGFFGKMLVGKSKTASLDDIVSDIAINKRTAPKVNAPAPETKAPVSEPIKDDGAVYTFNSARGRHLTVYKDKCVIKTKVSVGSVLTGNYTDGEKTIYYSDCIGVQFKQAGAMLGYVQLETASSSMNNKHSDFFNENSFTYEQSQVPNSKMEEVVSYIKSRIEEYKYSKVGSSAPTTIVQNNFSAADEIRKFKELLDMDAITPEEFEAKKKELLGL